MSKGKDFVDFKFEGCKYATFWGHYYIKGDLLRLSVQTTSTIGVALVSSYKADDLSRAKYPVNAHRVALDIDHAAARRNISFLRSEPRDVADAVCSWAHACRFIRDNWLKQEARIEKLQNLMDVEKRRVGALAPRGGA